MTNDELERIWKEDATAIYERCLPQLRNPTKNISHLSYIPAEIRTSQLSTVATRIVCLVHKFQIIRVYWLGLYADVIGWDINISKSLSWNNTRVISHNVIRLVVWDFKVNSAFHAHLYISLLKHNLELKWTGEVSTPVLLDWQVILCWPSIRKWYIVKHEQTMRLSPRLRRRDRGLLIRRIVHCVGLRETQLGHINRHSFFLALLFHSYISLVLPPTPPHPWWFTFWLWQYFRLYGVEW
jgi:hypothetical protein